VKKNEETGDSWGSQSHCASDRESQKFSRWTRIVIKPGIQHDEVELRLDKKMCTLVTMLRNVWKFGHGILFVKSKYEVKWQREGVVQRESR
jgi:hypothetical protein